MKLREYLDENIMEIKQFSQILQMDERTIYLWLTDDVTPLRINQLKIQKATNGKVTLQDWRPHERKKKANKRVRGTKGNGVRLAQHLDADKKAKLKSSKKGR